MKRITLFTIAILLLYTVHAQNVGIGTIAPGYKVEVIDTGFNKIISKFRSTGGYGEINISNGTDIVDIGATNGGGYLGVKTTGDLHIRTGAQSRIFIKNATGHVGIGNTTPGYRLHVLDTASHGVIALFENSTASTSQIVVHNGAAHTSLATAGADGFVGTLTDGDFSIRTNSVARITVKKSTGNIGIGTDTPDPSAKLEVTGTAGGFLPPRMTTSERDAITSPAKGLMVFVTNDSSYYFYDGRWRRLTPADDVWSVKGNSAATGNYIGTTNDQPINFKVNNTNRMTLDNTGRLQLHTTIGNLSIGMLSGTGGSDNLFMGNYAGFNTSGTNNFIIGNFAGVNNTTGHHNHFEGYLAGAENVSGSNNYFSGSLAGMKSRNSYNYASGTMAGYNNVRGMYNTFIGNYADTDNDSLVNAAAIGFEAVVSQSNSMVLGGTGNFRVNVGIGTTSPQTTLDVNSGDDFTNIATFRSAGGFGQILVTEGTLITDLGSSPGGGYVGTNSAGNFRLRTHGTTRVLIQDVTGNVGINTSSPTEKLEVNGNIKLSGRIQEEALQTPSLFPDWTNYGSGHAEAAYYKDKEGRVHLTGLVNYSSANPAGTIIFTLPAGYRPINGRLVFNILNNGDQGRIDIMADGNVMVLTGTTGWFSLDGISFRAE